MDGQTFASQSGAEDGAVRTGAYYGRARTGHVLAGTAVTFHRSKVVQHPSPCRLSVAQFPSLGSPRTVSHPIRSSLWLTTSAPRLQHTRDRWSSPQSPTTPTAQDTNCSHDFSSAITEERIEAGKAISRRSTRLTSSELLPSELEVEFQPKVDHEMGGDKTTLVPLYQPFHHASNARLELSRFGQAYRRRTLGSTA